MKIMNLLAEGGIGGIETLCNSIDASSNKMINYWCFFNRGGEISKEIKKRNPERTFILKRNLSIKKKTKEIIQICEINKVDIVAIHNSGTYCNILFHNLIKSKLNVKFVRFFHSCYEDKYFYPKSKIRKIYGLHCYNRAFKKADLLISVSQAVQESWRRKFDIEKVEKTVVYNGINDIFFSTKLKNKTTLRDRKCKIVFVGRVTKVKGVDILINAIKYLKDKNYNIQLTIVGDGEEKENLEKLTEELGLSEEVIFVGRQKNVLNWLDESDIFVYPSVCKEAFGISVVEAMARECIPIVSSNGGLTEIVDDGTNGYVVKKLDSKNLANTIEKCINAESTGKGIDKAEIRKKAEQFSINKTIERLEEEYGRILS